ncbi:MAG: hypothetical protein JHC61_03855 [Burkholderiaceae bacterium]|nr:hypothetical protein [Burkholderiaceae bacterium]
MNFMGSEIVDNREIYVPRDHTYEMRSFFNVGQAGRAVLAACAAAAYCSGRTALFSPTTMAMAPNVCNNVKFDKMPYSQFLARQFPPVLFTE